VPFSLSFEMLRAPVTRAIRGINNKTRFIKLAAVLPNPDMPAISSLDVERSKSSRAIPEKHIVYNINHLFLSDSLASFCMSSDIFL
jgi:hypothetical protein